MATRRKTKPKGNPKGQQVQVMGYYPLELAEQLNRLSGATRIPKAALLREALIDLLAKPVHAEALRKAVK